MTEFTVGDAVRFNKNKEGFVVPESWGTVVNVTDKQVFVKFPPTSVWHCNKEDLELMKYNLKAMDFVPSIPRSRSNVYEAFIFAETPEGYDYWMKFFRGEMSTEEEQEAYDKWATMYKQCIVESSFTEDTKANNSVEHPSHYNQDGGIECIDAIKASLGKDGFVDYCKGNCMKYLWRYKYKNGIEDLKKAKVYLEWIIKELEK